MKKLTITFALLASLGVTYAQRATNPTNDYGEKVGGRAPREMKLETNEFAGTEMSVSSRLVSFSDLPEMPKPTWAIITNPEGEFIKEARVNPQNNAMDIHKLQKGMYFVTIVYKNKSKKAFVLKIDE